MMKTSILILLSAICGLTFGQTNYNDVAVIVNDNSQTSMIIGGYFQTVRNIPNQNMIHIAAPTTEEIDSTQFQVIRAQIENYLIANNLVDSINYLVTTKGVPLKISGSCFSPAGSSISCASFDSELSLLLGPNASSIGQSGYQFNPVYNTTQHFSRSATGIYLVTRLTGYTNVDIYRMLDRSGPQTGINQGSAKAVLDLNNATSIDSSFFLDTYLQPVHDYLVANSWNSQIDNNFNPLLNQSNVFAYLYYGGGTMPDVNLDYDWTKGSVGIMEVCGVGSTFDSTQNPSNNLLLADFIAEGCTGAHGQVNCTFYSGLLNSDIFFDRYLDPTEDYNLAESFYMSERFLSWQSVIVGDPKASVIVDNTADVGEPEALSLRMFPNPSDGNFTVQSDQFINSIQIYNLSGALVYADEIQSSNKVDLNLTDLKDGVYLVHIQTEGKVAVERIVISHSSDS